MLYLILGKTGTGKTNYCLGQAAHFAKNGSPCVLVVPEQIVYTFERETVERLEGTAAALVEVKSCKRLSADILAERGGSARVRLDSAQKSVLIRKAVLECQDELQYYRKKSRDSAFYEMLARLFDELRNAGADGGKLRRAAEGCSSVLSGRKFTEIALILEHYEKLLESGFFDDAGELVCASSLTEGASKVVGKRFFFDGFTGFTQAEYTFIRSLLKSAADVYITLGCDGEESEWDTSVGVCYKTYLKLKALCMELFGTEPQEIHLEKVYRYKNDSIRRAGEYFGFGIKGEENEKTDDIFVMKADDCYDEAVRIADEIMYLVREEGYRYRDIDVLVRDADMYRQAITRTFRRFDIPFHFDESDDLESSALTTILDCAIEMAGGIRTNPVLRMLKTGVCDITEEEVSLLENYCFVHSVDRDDWNAPFTLSPSGFGEPAEHEKADLEKTEAARRKVAGWIQGFSSGASKLHGSELLKCAYGLVEDCGAAEGICRADGDGRKNADLCFRMVDRLYKLIGNDQVSRDELRSMLKLLSSSTEASKIPSVMDCVSVGDAAHSLPYNPRVVFVPGICEGTFPRGDFSGLIFTLEERDILLENDIRLAGCFEECTDLESYYLYKCVTAPSEKLYLSYCESNGKDKMQASAELEGYMSLFSPVILDRRAGEGIVNEKTAVDRFVRAFGEDDMLYLEAVAEKLPGKSEEIKERISYGTKLLYDTDVARKLTGEHMPMSASKLETYGKCSYRYFMKYMLGVEGLRKAEVSPAEAGTFVHEVMEDLLDKCGGDLTGYDEITLKAEVDTLADEYISRVFETQKTTKRILSVLDQIKENTFVLARHIMEEQNQSLFRVDDCELKIGREGDIEAVRFALDDGGEVYLEGYIDRVDSFTDKESGRRFMRVVDYKTGSKEFRLNEVLQGINVQMLMYLFAVCKNGKERYGSNIVPAGVLYQLGEARSASSAEDAAKAYHMDGLILDDPLVLSAMEKDGKGRYIKPRLKGGDWDKRTTKNVCISEEQFARLEAHMDKIITDMATMLRSGHIEARPEANNGRPDGCQYCEYAAVCAKDRITEYRELSRDAAEEFLKGGNIYG